MDLSRIDHPDMKGNSSNLPEQWGSLRVFFFGPLHDNDEEEKVSHLFLLVGQVLRQIYNRRQESQMPMPKS